MRVNDPVAYWKKRSQTPEYKAKKKEYQQTPKYKAYDKKRQQTPEYKARKKKYDAEYRAKKKAETQGEGTLEAFLK